jgi:serine/threonine protein kinase
MILDPHNSIKIKDHTGSLNSPLPGKFMISLGDRFDPYLELGFVPGGTLSDYLTSHINLTNSNRLDGAQTSIILYGVAFALSILHAGGWVHRDIKSENIFLDGRGRPVVGDFSFSPPIERATTK